MSKFFLLKRGCRQGDPLSPYIFLLFAEVLGQMLRKNINIKGIAINNKEMKISQYADDTQILLDGTERSLRESLQVLSKFYKLSGLKRELIALLSLSSWCLVMVELLFLAVPRGCLQFVIVVYPDHTHLLFLKINEEKKRAIWIGAKSNSNNKLCNDYK